MNSSEESLAIANTILDQMGGMGRLRAMVGVSQAVALESGVRFAFKGSTKTNKCVVKLEPSDTYTVEFWQCKPYRYSAKTGKQSGGSVKVAEFDDVHADSLVELFESTTGLYLRL